MDSAIVSSVIRSALISAGGVAFGSSTMQTDDAQAIVGAIVVLITAAWSVYSKWRAARVKAGQ